MSAEKTTVKEALEQEVTSSEFSKATGIRKESLARIMRQAKLATNKPHSIIAFLDAITGEYEMARGKKMAAQAEKAQIELAQMRGALYDADQIEIQFHETLRAIAARVKMIPHSWAHRVNPQRPDKGKEELQRLVEWMLEPLPERADDAGEK